MTQNKIIVAIAAGLAGGLVDILAAFVIFPATPVQILQSIASGVMGPSAFQGGATTAGFGLFWHVVISILFAALYLVGAAQAPVMLRRPILWGAGFGVFVYGVMNAIVVPLSLAAERPDPPALMLGLGLFANVLFGVAIALVAARAPRAPVEA